MKTIGFLGGMSWESSALYYRLTNTIVREELGGLHSSKSLMASVDFAQMEALMATGSWDEIGELLTVHARSLEAAGADFIVLCTNTMHKVAPAIEAGIGIRLLHIADATADAVIAAGLSSIALLGTAFTMEQDFYRDRIAARGLDVSVPQAADRQTVHRIIFDELVRGDIRPDSRESYLEIIGRLVDDGAEGVILGCTEIETLVTQADTSVPLFPTTRIHAQAAVALAMEGA